MNAPDGLPSWLVLVLFLLFGSPALCSKSAAKLPSVLGAGARWWQARQPDNQVEARRSSSYEKQEAEIARISRQYDRVNEDFEELSERVDGWEKKLTETNRRFFAALSYIRYLVATILRLDPGHSVEPPPEILRDFL
ncbi:hypothetical protein L5G28_04670 [Gordonia sp. HY285]|uniref:hypothetical protein n=1 Tax=Gordonia liuliyuniae TaxID=2911517 RepID=UPI001F3B5963|nr:hypothetical protein [Gordonia liuliyuniae]MCF8609454.1 hypothetical protein [Gordonia liuliyuniae]